MASALLAPPAPLKLSRSPRLPEELRSFLARFGLSIDSLLTSGSANAKLAKGSGLAFSSLLHLLPARSLARALSPSLPGSVSVRGELPALRELADREGLTARALLFSACPFATEACQDLCLAFSGHGGLSTDVASCRGRRALALLSDRALFAKALLWAAGLSYRKARRLGLPFALRFNGTQELPWQEAWLGFSLSSEEAEAFSLLFGAPFSRGFHTLPEALRSVPFLSLYDYAKAPLFGRSGLIAAREAGVHVTASFAADQERASSRAIDAAEHGFSVAVPILLPKGELLPSSLLLRDQHGREALLQCIDGDANDLRMLDPAPAPGFSGLAVLLRLKRSRGAKPESASRFALPLGSGSWQALPDGGSFAFSRL
jgi:hypothetical protein